MGQVSLRNATMDDAGFLFALVNDLECRKNSLNPDKISFEKHIEWLKKILVSQKKRQYILIENDEPIGQGRLELVEAGCRISYSIIPQRRGCGYGKLLLRLLNKLILEVFPCCVYSYGEVMPYNVASQRVFEELGYEVQVADGFLCYRKKIGQSIVEENDILLGGGVLLLSNNKNSYVLYDWLKSKGEKVYFYSGRLNESQILYLKPSLIISYNYSFLIPESVISLVEGKIINMHISFLPWNKGSDPNFWSFIENTPKGVTIHRLSAGLDQGAILLQKRMFFDEDIETFRSTYEKLNQEIVLLLERYFLEIKNNILIPREQPKGGSYHRKKEFTEFIEGKEFDWDETIQAFKKRYKII